MRAALYWRPVIVSPREVARESLIQILGSRISITENTVWAQGFPSSAAIEWVQAQSANLCFVDLSVEEERSFQIARQLVQSGITVVALHSKNSSDLILRCFREGIHEFVAEPFDGESVWSVLEALAIRRCKSGPNLSGSVYMVLPSKQSFGATTVAIGMGVRASHKNSGSVLLVDLDPFFGSVRFNLKLKGGSDFLHAFSNWRRIDEDLWRELTIRHAGMDVLAAPESWVDSSFSGPSPLDFINFCRERYAITFLDCPGLITNWYRELASQVDGLILVTTNELIAVHSTKRTLEALAAAGCESAKIKLILNRYNQDVGVTAEAMESALERPIFHRLPNDYESIERSIISGKPVGSDSRIGKGLDELWSRLAGKPKSEPVAKRSWSSVFSLARH